MKTARALCLAALITLPCSAVAQQIVMVTDDVDVSTTWTANNEYVLTRVIHVTNGATLTIEPGTVIRGESESAPGANDPGTLVVTRGSRLLANGTCKAPITFTNLDDDNVGNQTGSFPYDTLENALSQTGTWGGVVLLGYGYVANDTAGGPDDMREVQIEGLTAAGGLGLYGNCASSMLLPDECDDDSSGALTHVSIRYGGFNLSANNEINGLTLGAVGRGTELDYIEVFQNKDDGIEFFGGAADLKHAVVIAAGDDGIDYDEGWRGKAQFLYVQQGLPGTDKSDKAGEHDGGNSPDGSLPLATPAFYNVTYLGQGAARTDYTDAVENTALVFRDNAGGRYYNSFFGDFGGATLVIEGGGDGTSSTEPDTSGERTITPYVEDGQFFPGPSSEFQLELRDNTFWCFGEADSVYTGVCDVSGNACLSNADCAGGETCVSGAGAVGGNSGKIHHDPGIFTDAAFDNEYLDCASPLPIRELTRLPNPDPTRPDPLVSVDPRPAPGGPLLVTERLPPQDGFYEQAAYRGAFGDFNWAEDWTNADRLGYFPDETQVLVTTDITTSTTWTADKEYVLTEIIHVTNGATLTIEPGTVIRGEPESAPGANDPGTLVVTRGSRLEANGTAEAPIVFTNLDDDNVGDSPGTFPYDSLENAIGTTGTWGGVVLLGYGYVANDTAAGPDAAREVQIEGLTAAGGLGLYGNCASSLLMPDECDDDDSGSLRYVSIRYGGFNLSANNEINGLTLGAVGRSTNLEYIEVFQNKDDGVEFFGGAAELKHAVVTSAGDDGFDYDEGWRGKVQFGFVLQGIPGTDKSDKGGEHDGGNSPDGSLPLAAPAFYNVTYLGQGAARTDYTDAVENTALVFRDNAGGRYYNSFFGDFGGAALVIEGGGDGTSSTEPDTSGERTVTPYVEDGLFFQGPSSEFQLELRDNSFWCFGEADSVYTGVCDVSGDTCLSNADCPGAETCVSGAGAVGGNGGKIHHDPGIFTDAAFNNEYLDCASPLPIRLLDRLANPDLTRPDPVVSIDPRPTAGGPLWSGVRSVPADGFFEPVDHRGAFGRTNWALGWTAMDRLGYFPGTTSVNVDGDIDTSTTWTADNEYVLGQVVHVTNGATLTIEPGTVVRGEPESAPGANDPGTLVVTRGSRIVARGTAEAPIVFTNLDDDNVGASRGSFPYDELENALGQTGTWGGVILLGYGYVANDTASGPDAAREVQIEGLTAAGGLGLYGNCAASMLSPDECDDDTSGVMEYVSMRYGGFNLSANNEINGLTLGAVGRGTELDYIEVFQNKDDGIEFFGGAAQIKHAIVALPGDDGFDYDEGWRGKVQFGFVLQGLPGTDRSDKAGEHDGGNSPDGSLPLATPAFYNVTYLGHGAARTDYTDAVENTALVFRDNAGGRYYNSFFGDFGGATLVIEGGGDGTSSTEPDTSGERTITPYVEDGRFFPGPSSEFQLELRDNTFWCFGEADNVYTGVCDVSGNACLSNADCAGGETCVSGAGAVGGNGGKIHHDPGIFTDAAFDNEYLDCANPLPIRTLQRLSNPDPTRPDPVVSVDPRPAPGSVLLDRVAPSAPADGFCETTSYRGAFGQTNWAEGWSTLSRLGYFPVCGEAATARPGEVQGLRFAADKATLTWEALPAGAAVQGYDVLRRRGLFSLDAADFGIATFLESGDSDLRARDSERPAESEIFFYQVRAANCCGTGTLGYWSTGAERIAP